MNEPLTAAELAECRRHLDILPKASIHYIQFPPIELRSYVDISTYPNVQERINYVSQLQRLGAKTAVFRWNHNIQDYELERVDYE